VTEALRARVGVAATQAMFGRAGLLHHLQCPPEAMVEEAEVRALHSALREQLGPDEATAVACDAGRRTAEYLLAHRIPRPVQAVLQRLPAAMAARILLAAIRRHAWTFVGSGVFVARAGSPVVLTIRNNPLCRDLAANTPVCDFYAATFERLFTVLVHSGSRVRELACEACGDAECRFEIRW
jgi:divinyl protochlorophyllide a 8-vinyl-reductase